MQSMTGFGRMELAEEGRRMTVEIKSVNNRFLDLNVRGPRSLSLLEEGVRDEVKTFLSRGRVEVFIGYENTREDAKEVRVDAALAAAYMEGFRILQEATGLTDTVSLSQLARMGDVLLVSERAEDMDALEGLLRRTVRGALEALTLFRAQEGEKLREDICGRLAALRAGMETIAQAMPQLLADYQARLTARVAELLGDSGAVDPTRIATEVAIMADRVAIDEELTRLDSHLRQMEATMALEEPVGRKLDFIVQELNREVNTICSKSADVRVTAVGLDMKNEIEKIREQVQNIE